MKSEEILRFVKENNIGIVDLNFNDLPGLLALLALISLRMKRIPTKRSY